MKQNKKMNAEIKMKTDFFLDRFNDYAHLNIPLSKEIVDIRKYFNIIPKLATMQKSYLIENAKNFYCYMFEKSYSEFCEYINEIFPPLPELCKDKRAYKLTDDEIEMKSKFFHDRIIDYTFWILPLPNEIIEICTYLNYIREHAVNYYVPTYMVTKNVKIFHYYMRKKSYSEFCEYINEIFPSAIES